jgi:hypothetical protein
LDPNEADVRSITDLVRGTIASEVYFACGLAIGKRISFTIPSGDVTNWDAHLWEPGGDGLRSRLDIRDGALLHRASFFKVAGPMQELADGRAPIVRTFDAAHLRDIHGHLFQDVFDWAGEYGTVDFGRGGVSSLLGSTHSTTSSRSLNGSSIAPWHGKIQALLGF